MSFSSSGRNRHRRRKKKLRSITEIEKEIAKTHEEVEAKKKGRKHWDEVVRDVHPLTKNIVDIKTQDSSYERILGFIKSSELTSESQRRIKSIENEIRIRMAEINNRYSQPEELGIPFLYEMSIFELLPSGFDLNRNIAHGVINQIIIMGRVLDLNAANEESYKSKLGKLNNEIEAARRAKRKKEKHEQVKAKVAQFEGKSRNIAVAIKSGLPTDHVCPYCGGPLGSDFHADHIYPISKGGHSVKKNMVNVCSDCNLSKRDKTLWMFISEHGLDHELIAHRLKALEKDF